MKGRAICPVEKISSVIQLFPGDGFVDPGAGNIGIGNILLEAGIGYEVLSVAVARYEDSDGKQGKRVDGDKAHKC